jgi:hypothetical protein
VRGTEIVLSRTAERNNSSAYFLNGKKSSFTEVTKLLKAKGVDLANNRFLILQVLSCPLQSQSMVTTATAAARPTCPGASSSPQDLHSGPQACQRARRARWSRSP